MATIAHEDLPVVEVVVLHRVPDAVGRTLLTQGGHPVGRGAEARRGVDLLHERGVALRKGRQP